MKMTEAQKAAMLRRDEAVALYGGENCGSAFITYGRRFRKKVYLARILWQGLRVLRGRIDLQKRQEDQASGIPPSDPLQMRRQAAGILLYVPPPGDHREGTAGQVDERRGDRPGRLRV